MDEMEIDALSDEGKLAERKVEIRVRKNGRKDKIIVEKSAAKGLPKGWIKKLIIRNKTGHKSRRDPYFIDPKSEYVFQSFKDALRYVESGVIGNHARKLKESNNEDDDDTGNGKSLLLLESVEKRSSCDLLEKKKETNAYVKNSKRRSLPSSDEHSKSCKLSSNLGKKEDAKDSTKKQPISSNDNDKTMADKYPMSRRVTRSQVKARENEDGDSDSARKDLFSSSNAKSEEHTVKSKLSSARAQDPEQESVMKEKSQDCTKRSVLNVIGSRITRSKSKVKKNDDNHDLKQKKEVNNSVPRRASKRLAGIELDPVPELKRRTSAQRVPALVRSDESTAEKCKQPVLQVNPTTSCCEKTDRSLNQQVAKSYNDHSLPKSDAATSNCLSTETAVETEKMGKSVHTSPSDDKKIIETPLVTAEKASEGNCKGESSMNDCYKQMGEMSPVSPLSCQSSVAKCENTGSRTLGESLRLNPKSKLTSLQANEMPLVSDKIEHPSDTQWRNKLGKDFSVPPSSNFAVVKGSCSNVIENNTNSLSEPPAFDLTLADLWKDPCIAFAIKILTGEPLHLPNNAALSSDTKNCKMVNNPTKQKQISFSPEMPEKVNMGAEKPGFSSELPSEYMWKDPCIDFAIKTLTDAIPIRLDEPPKSYSKSERPRGTSATQTPESRDTSNNCLLHQYTMKPKAISSGENWRQNVLKK